MKPAKLSFLSFLILAAFTAHGQLEENKATFRMGDGLTFSLNNGAYKINFGGFLTTEYAYDKVDGEKSTNTLNIPNAFLSISGTAVKEKLSFLIQTNFSLSSPLMDAWVAYAPAKQVKISFGQKQTFTNNREMMFREDRSALGDRSILSQNLANTGREFGIFVEGNFHIGQVGILPKLAATSGDGRNSFGTNSSDVDKGGFKYGGRLDLYPLGDFTGYNDQIGADIFHENKPKLVMGVAWSYNRGASDPKGDGHGTFTMYDKQGEESLPDYRKLYADLLFKWSGFHLLGEYANATATALSGLYTGTGVNTVLEPGQIAGFLNLGNAYNGEIGYVTRNGFALDGRYTEQVPEFNNSNNIYPRIQTYTVGFSKYFIDNRLKIQANFSQSRRPDLPENKNEYRGELFVQMVL